MVPVLRTRATKGARMQERSQTIHRLELLCAAAQRAQISLSRPSQGPNGSGCTPDISHEARSIDWDVLVAFHERCTRWQIELSALGWTSQQWHTLFSVVKAALGIRRAAVVKDRLRGGGTGLEFLCQAARSARSGFWWDRRRPGGYQSRLRHGPKWGRPRGRSSAILRLASPTAGSQRRGRLQRPKQRSGCCLGLGPTGGQLSTNAGGVEVPGRCAPGAWCP
jgi:hypothetical protein